jgi:hypothetical protein
MSCPAEGTMERGVSLLDYIFAMDKLPATGQKTHIFCDAILYPK